MKSNIKIISDGLLLGMILQIAVGPVCLYLINVSILNNFAAGFIGIIAATIADSIFILLGILGVSKLLTERRVKIFKAFGGILLITFGLITIFSFIGSKSTDNSFTLSIFGSKNVFLYTFILTLSSPLSIIFWSGIFSVKIIEEQYKNKDLILFSIGCLLATFLFLTFVVSASTILQSFLTEFLIKTLNIAVGIIIAFFGVKLFYAKPKKSYTF